MTATDPAADLTATPAAGSTDDPSVAAAAADRDPGAVTLDELNELSEDAFVAMFGGVLEGAAHLARAVAAQRPFGDRAGVVASFAAAVEALDEDEAVDLLRAHPELGARSAMAPASLHEQAAAGLRHAPAELDALLAAGNAAYRQLFGFPFVIAVQGRTTDEIVRALGDRLGGDRETELASALEQVCRIARHRVERLVSAS